MGEILNYPIYFYLYKYNLEEHEYEKEGFILTHDHSNGPIS